MFQGKRLHNANTTQKREKEKCNYLLVRIASIMCLQEFSGFSDKIQFCLKSIQGPLQREGGYYTEQIPSWKNTTIYIYSLPIAPSYIYASERKLGGSKDIWKVSMTCYSKNWNLRCKINLMINAVFKKCSLGVYWPTCSQGTWNYTFSKLQTYVLGKTKSPRLSFRIQL